MAVHLTLPHHRDVRATGRIQLAPQARGHVEPRVVDALERQGWRVHRIGRAAYLHDRGRDRALIVGVWRRRSPAPAWAHRLGVASAGYLRRVDRLTLEQRWRRIHRDAAGRFAAALPWYRWPTPAVYRFEPSRPGWWDLERSRVADHNRAVLADRWAER